MPKFLAAYRLGSLRPIDDSGKDALRSLKPDQQIMVEFKRARNPLHHRKLFAMLNLVLENQEHYKSTDELLAACKVAIGYCDYIKTKHGMVGIPKSIAFHALDQSGFDEFYNKAVEWVISDVIPSLSRQDLDAEVAEQLRRF